MASSNFVHLAHLDLGTISLQESVRHEFWLTNRSDAALKIRNAVSTCDCLAIKVFPRSIMPQGAEALEIELRPTKPGEFHYAALISFEDGNTGLLSIAARVQPGAEKPASLNHYSAAQGVLSAVGQDNNLVFVDVRSADAFNRVHIPGSLNLPLHLIKTHRSLQQKRVLLVNHGMESAGVESECGRLTAIGFKNVRILAGGIRGWVQLNGPTAGTGRPEDALLLDPLESSISRFDSGWLKVRIDRVGETDRNRDLLDGVMVEWSGSPDALEQSLAKLALATPGTRQVLLYNARGNLEKEPMPNFSSLRSIPVFVLRGGLAAWQEQVVLELGRMGGRKFTLSSSAPANVRLSVGTHSVSGTCCGGKK